MGDPSAVLTYGQTGQTPEASRLKGARPEMTGHPRTARIENF